MLTMFNSVVLQELTHVVHSQCVTKLMGWGLLPEGNEGSQPSVAVASALCKHLATQEEEEEEGEQVGEPV